MKLLTKKATVLFKSFAEALRSRKPIDEAVAEARQELLTLYKFNQPAWTLPVLYLHPDFDGELIKSFDEGITELPDTGISSFNSTLAKAYLRSLSQAGQSMVFTLWCHPHRSHERQ